MTTLPQDFGSGCGMEKSNTNSGHEPRRVSGARDRAAARPSPPGKVESGETRIISGKPRPDTRVVAGKPRADETRVITSRPGPGTSRVITGRGAVARSSGRGSTRLQNADKLFEIATKKGGYKAYEQAIVAYTAAITGGQDVDKAKAGKTQAQLAYAREALINKDFELAQRLVDPVLGLNREAEALARRIREKRLAYRMQRPSIPYFRYAMIALGVLFVLFAVNAYNYLTYDDEGEEGMLVQMVDRALATHTIEGIQKEFYNVYTEVTLRRASLGVYPTFRDAFPFLQDASIKLVNARSAPPAEKAVLYDYMVAHLPLLLTFQAELLQEEDDERRSANRQIVERMQNLTGHLIKFEGEATIGNVTSGRRAR